VFERQVTLGNGRVTVVARSVSVEPSSCPVECPRVVLAPVRAHVADSTDESLGLAGVHLAVECLDPFLSGPNCRERPVERAVLGPAHPADIREVHVDGRGNREAALGVECLRYVRRVRTVTGVRPAEQIEQVELLRVGDIHQAAERRADTAEFGRREVGASQGL
jgi:hypothetical protein